jgi:hypothetical protein
MMKSGSMISILIFWVLIFCSSFSGFDVDECMKMVMKMEKWRREEDELIKKSKLINQMIN